MANIGRYSTELIGDEEFVVIGFVGVDEADRQAVASAAGGAVFSLALIALINGLVILLVLKVLFPGMVSLSEDFKRALGMSAGFWKGAWAWSRVFWNRLARLVNTR